MSLLMCRSRVLMAVRVSMPATITHAPATIQAEGVSYYNVATLNEFWCAMEVS